jgi:tetratricopeptide (TPR) repeat protein
MSTLSDPKQVLRQVEDLKRRSRALRDTGELDKAAELVRQAIDILAAELRERDVVVGLADAAAPQDVRDLAAQLADCYGSLGGILRRKVAHEEALECYAQGKRLEQNDAYRISNSYNQVQWLVLRVLLHPELIANGNREMLDELETAIQSLRRQIMTARRQDPWAHSDVGLLHTLLGDRPGANRAWAEVDALDPLPSVYSSGLAVLKELQRVLPDDEVLDNAVARFERKAASAS